ncbi:hypothetical protein TKK_0008515 [Trichogramma kaykai]
MYDCSQETVRQQRIDHKLDSLHKCWRKDNDEAQQYFIDPVIIMAKCDVEKYADSENVAKKRQIQKNNTTVPKNVGATKCLVDKVLEPVVERERM